jgi:hypothetical protein
MILLGNLYFLYGSMFLCGFSASVGLVAFTMTMELIESNKTNTVASLIVSLDATLPIFVSFYFMLISKNWIYYGYAIVFITLASLILISIYIPETPAFYISKNRLDKACESLSQISMFNTG